MYLHYSGEVENIYTTLRQICSVLCTKFYQNRLGFVDDVIKHFGVFFRFTVSTVVHLQNVNAKFDKVV